MPQSLNVILLVLLFFINILGIYIVLKSTKANENENINAELIYINHVINNLRKDIDSVNNNITNIKNESGYEMNTVTKYTNQGLNDSQIAKITNKSVKEIELIKKLNLNKKSSINNMAERKN